MNKNDQRGFILIVVTIIMAVLLALGGTHLSMISSEQRLTLRSYRRISAINLAEAGIELAIWELRYGGGDFLSLPDDWNGTNPTTKTVHSSDTDGLSSGDFAVTVTDPTSANPIIEATGYAPNMSSPLMEKRMVKVKGTYGPPSSRGAAITTNGPTDSKGNLQVDGREHDENGTLIADSGTLGLSTTSTYDQGGSSDVGGTSAGVDYAPSKPGNPLTIETGADWTAEGGFPATPDKVMGGTENDYPEGTLKTRAQSGVDGSQYVTDPADLNFPLSGVTYVELPAGETWNAIDFDVDGEHSSGILIVHNSSTNAIMKNLNVGTFKGLIIADDMVHIHCTIIGAVMVLSSAPSSGNCIGNGNGSVLYSSQALSSAGKGGGGSSFSVTSWQEK